MLTTTLLYLVVGISDGDTLTDRCGQPGDYTICEMPRGNFTVRDRHGARLYFGRGPVSVVTSPAPF